MVNRMKKVETINREKIKKIKTFFVKLVKSGFTQRLEITVIDITERDRRIIITIMINGHVPKKKKKKCKTRFAGQTADHFRKYLSYLPLLYNDQNLKGCRSLLARGTAR